MCPLFLFRDAILRGDASVVEQVRAIARNRAQLTGFLVNWAKNNPNPALKKLAYGFRTIRWRARSTGFGSISAAQTMMLAWKTTNPMTNHTTVRTLATIPSPSPPPPAVA